MTRVFVVAVAAIALACPAWAQESADEAQIQVEWSGYSAVLTAGGTPVRGFAHMDGKSSRGPVSGIIVNGQFGQPTMAVPDWCTGSSVVFAPLVGPGFGGVRFASTGDLLEFKSVPDADPPSADWGFCWDLTTLKYTGRAIGVVIGGTGKFEAATGTVDIRFSGRCFEQNCSTPLTPFTQTVVVALHK